MHMILQDFDNGDNIRVNILRVMNKEWRQLRSPFWILILCIWTLQNSKCSLKFHAVINKTLISKSSSISSTENKHKTVLFLNRREWNYRSVRKTNRDLSNDVVLHTTDINVIGPNHYYTFISFIKNIHVILHKVHPSPDTLVPRPHPSPLAKLISPKKGTR